MEENNKSIDGIVEKLALIVEATETLFPDGKMAVVFQLNGDDFKKVQDNLYNLIHNFDNIVSKINGKKTSLDNVPYVEKLEALAKVQCEAYYAIGVLK